MLPRLPLWDRLQRSLRMNDSEASFEEKRERTREGGAATMAWLIRGWHTAEGRDGGEQ